MVTMKIFFYKSWFNDSDRHVQLLQHVCIRSLDYRVNFRSGRHFGFIIIWDVFIIAIIVQAWTKNSVKKVDTLDTKELSNVLGPHVFPIEYIPIYRLEFKSRMHFQCLHLQPCLCFDIYLHTYILSLPSITDCFSFPRFDLLQISRQSTLIKFEMVFTKIDMTRDKKGSSKGTLRHTDKQTYQWFKCHRRKMLGRTWRIFQKDNMLKGISLYCSILNCSNVKEFQTTVFLSNSINLWLRFM